ncbi:MAG: FAD-binding oxidoreductase [Pseudomonadota bacterium]
MTLSTEPVLLLQVNSMTYDVFVLGAGMVGTGCAHYLQESGKTVALVDKGAPGMQTSHGNAGIIQREAIQPYAFPRQLSVILTAAANRRTDIRYQLPAVPSFIRPLRQYYHYSAPARYAGIAREYASLISLSLETHNELIHKAGAEALTGTHQWLALSRTDRHLEESYLSADLLAEQGVSHTKLSAEDLKLREPDISPLFPGAVMWTSPRTIRDPSALVQSYVDLFLSGGGTFISADAQTLSRTRDGLWEIRNDQGDVSQARQVVVALGPWSTLLTAKFGYQPPLFSKRGYHRHYKTQSGKQLNNWVLDAEKGFLLAPMNRGIRLTTGAELARLDDPQTPRQLEQLEPVARRDFPLGERADDETWSGSRPCFPDMKPVIGEVPGVSHMWCAFGHGHQGFTLGPATGMLLAQMMTGQKTAIEMQPFRPGRWT